MQYRRRGRSDASLFLTAGLREISLRRILVRCMRRNVLVSARGVLLGCHRRCSQRNKVFSGYQRGDEERPGQKTKAASALVCTLGPSFKISSTLLDYFLLFYFVH